jgi:hypothetical protein
MVEIIIDTFLDDNIRLYIEYNYINNKYTIIYINNRYSDYLINDSYLYNQIHDWYSIIINNFFTIRDLNENDFLEWLGNNA